MKTLTRDPKLEQLRAEIERLSSERDAAVAERDALAKVLEQSSTERAQLEQDKAKLEQLAAQLGQDKAKLEKALAALEHKYQQLCRQLFGRSSEKVAAGELADAIRQEEARAQAEGEVCAPPHVGETTDGETPEVPIPELPAPPPEEKRRQKGHGRRPRPKKVRRERVPHPLPPEELVCDCCGGELRSIGSDETTERYDYRPSSLVIVEHVRPRYRCPTCQYGTISAPLPPAPISRGLAEPGLLAYVAASKYGDHLPLNRLRGILLREGVDFPRSTLCDWVQATGDLLKGIAEEVRRNVLSRDVVGMDETGIRIVFDPKDKENGTRNGKIWVYRGLKGEVYFRVSETKAHEDPNGPQVVLRHYKGLLQADAAGIFDVLFEDGTRIEVGCNAHYPEGAFIQSRPFDAWPQVACLPFAQAYAAMDSG